MVLIPTPYAASQFRRAYYLLLIAWRTMMTLCKIVLVLIA